MCSTTFMISLENALRTASTAQYGALGEEAASVFLENQMDATLVSMGDAGMPRTGNLQDLDITAVVDGEFIAFEVKTRYRSRRAGRLTRGGDLLRPRLSRTSTGSRQGSQGYATARIGDIVDTGDGYEGVQVQLIVIDLRLMMLQVFALNDDGRILASVTPPVDCASEVQTGYKQIVGHRGHL